LWIGEVDAYSGGDVRPEQKVGPSIRQWAPQRSGLVGGEGRRGGAQVERYHGPAGSQLLVGYRDAG
jgi:hypothetical protein